MKRPYKLILASLLCVAPLGALLPGCGGGGGGSNNNTTGGFKTRLGLLFNDTNFGNIQLQFPDSTTPERSLFGTLQILGPKTPVPSTPVATPTPGGAPTPTPTTPNQIDFLPEPGTYAFKGTITVNGNNATYEGKGAFSPGVPFVITGSNLIGSRVRVVTTFPSGTKVIEAFLLADPVTNSGPTATPAPTAVVTNTPNGTATPGGTATPTSTTSPAATATPIGTATPTPVATNTPFPTATPIV